MASGKLVLGIILLLVGLFYAGAPHDIHVSTPLGLGLDHMMHIVLGVVLIVIGVVLIWKR